MEVLFNPVIISVIILCTLCLLKINVLLALMVSSIVAGFLSGNSISEIMDTFIGGMGANSETALSYILLGAFAMSMVHTGLAFILTKKISNIIKSNKYLLIGILTLIAILSQNLIPVHIAFIPILIPPLIGLMNKLKIDRRAVASALAYGLKTPYIVLPAGFGLIFHGLLADNITQNGMQVAKSDIWHYVWFLGLAMTVGLLFALFVSYKKPRVYDDILICKNEESEDEKLNKSHYITIFAAVMTLVIQLWTSSLPLGALVGLGIIFGTKTLNHHHMDKLINEGVSMMGYVAFVMLVAGGFAMVLKSTGGVELLVTSIAPYMVNKFVATALMLFVGLFITMGIGTSFGTIPILAVLYVPIGINLGFSVSAMVIVLAAAAALGDAGSPASDTTLGPTSGLNADGQHNHVWDTCIPTFLHYNIPLILFALFAVILF